jgi:hypothetical protein
MWAHLRRCIGVVAARHGRQPRRAQATVMCVVVVAAVMGVSSVAGADTVINGCTIVSNPTPTNFTDCPTATLTGANLTGADLSFADLAGAQLNLATLTGANLTDADLSFADLTDAQLLGANLTDAFLGQAQLAVANLTGANLTGADFTLATWGNTTCPDGSNSDNDGFTCVGVPGALLPGAPTIGTASNVSSGVTLVTWSPPSSDGGSPITAYVVQSLYRVGNSWAFGPSAISGPYQMQHRVPGLTGGTQYWFRVTAHNAVGAGPHSKVTQPGLTASP